MQQLLKESVCDYTTFIKDLTDMVKEMMGEEYTARIYKVMKNNSLELDSLVLLKEGRSFAPNIYLLPYYEAYTEGTGMVELAKRICDICLNCTAPVREDKFTYTFDDVKTNIIYRLVSYDKNRKLLNTIPHLRYLDLAVTFHCLVHDDEDGIGTIRITNEHLELWNTTPKELHRLAVTNTKKMFPPSIRSMEEVIKSMLTQDYYKDNDSTLPEEAFQDLLDQSGNCNNRKMYILSNPKGINGATCLLYENILLQFSNQMKSDLYILPSSIHEVILIPYDKSITKEALEAMVKDVNRTQVAGDEVLSDRVYFYSRENNAITM
jgi:hypothetical protein